MTGYHSKRAAARDKLEDDDTQVYQRPWVGLTDDERLIALKFIDPKTAKLPEGFKQFAESIEQLLKERNK